MLDVAIAYQAKHTLLREDGNVVINGTVLEAEDQPRCDSSSADDLG
jgi:hypothetical protein